MRTSIAAILVLTICVLAAAAAPATKPSRPGRPADEPPAIATTQQAVHRITGLFPHDREAELRDSVKQFPGIEIVSIDFDHAEVTFSYDPAKAFAGTKPDKLIDRFDQQLRSASNHTFGVKPRSTTPRDKLTRVEIQLAPIDCKACCLAIYEVLARQDGVEQATADMKSGVATALIDPDVTSQAKLEAALKAREVTLKPPAKP